MREDRFIKLDNGGGFNTRYLEYWETTAGGHLLIHLTDGSFITVCGNERCLLLRYLENEALDLRAWAAGKQRYGN